MKKIEKIEVITSRDWTRNENGRVDGSRTHIEYITVKVVFGDGSVKEETRHFENGQFSDDFYALETIMNMYKFHEITKNSVHSYNACSLWYDHEVYTVNSDYIAENPIEEPAETEEEPATVKPEIEVIKSAEKDEHQSIEIRRINNIYRVNIYGDSKAEYCSSSSRYETIEEADEAYKYYCDLLEISAEKPAADEEVTTEPYEDFTIVGSPAAGFVIVSTSGFFDKSYKTVEEAKKAIDLQIAIDLNFETEVIAEIESKINR